VVISHIDRTIFDEERLLRLADSGVTIEFDLFGQEASYYGLSDIDMPNDATRLELIRALIDHGHLDRVVISHDICYRTRLTTFGGHGYGHIFRNVVPMMKKRGYGEAEIDAILVGKPEALLTSSDERPGGVHDPQAIVGRLPPLFAQAQSQDGQAPQPRPPSNHAPRPEKHERAVQYFKRQTRTLGFGRSPLRV
jgi:hypothetical protein